jgi:hypothetical protein
MFSHIRNEDPGDGSAISLIPSLFCNERMAQFINKNNGKSLATAVKNNE